MGFHICEYCEQEGTLGEAGTMLFGPFSSADVTLRFASGRSWQFPHVGLLHYVTMHNYLPPAEFIDDVMNSQVLAGQFAQTKSMPMSVGYLQGLGFPTGEVPEGFTLKLMELIEQAKNRQDYLSFRQTRGG